MFKATQDIYRALQQVDGFKVFTDDHEKSSDAWLQFSVKNGSTYRIRFKVDWNSVDPGGQLAANGTATGSNGILANGGAILDATLQVTGTNTGITGAENGNGEARYYDLSGRRLHAAPAHGVYIKGNRKVVK